MNGPMLANMRALRKSLKMTQEEFAKSLGISKTTYNNYETGTREPGHKFIMNVALLYNVTTDYLLGLSDSPLPSQTRLLSSNNLTSHEIEIALAYRKASADDRGIVDLTLKKYMKDDRREKLETAIG